MHKLCDAVLAILLMVMIVVAAGDYLVLYQALVLDQPVAGPLWRAVVDLILITNLSMALFWQPPGWRGWFNDME